MNWWEHLFRHQAGRMVSTLTRILGPRHLQLAEDVVSEALIRALELWPHRGIPIIPRGVIEAARNHALDVLRREASLAAKAVEVARAWPVGGADFEAMDDQLGMIFLCAHPAVPREARAALTLKTVCGFSTAEIARAFLIQETAAAQRIVRAKRLVRDLSFALPEDGELAARRDGVLEVLYLMFNEGYTRSANDLCEEAIRLGRLVATPAAGAPEADALRAFLFASRPHTCEGGCAGRSLPAGRSGSRPVGSRESEGLRAWIAAPGERITSSPGSAIAAAHATAPV